MGARDASHYAELTRQAMNEGVRFTFRRTGVVRLAYYHRRTGRFVVVNPETQHILSFAKKSENYVRALAGSTYDVDRARGSR